MGSSLGILETLKNFKASCLVDCGGYYASKTGDVEEAVLRVMERSKVMHGS